MGLQLLVIAANLKIGRVLPAVIGLVILLGLVRRSTLMWWMMTFSNLIWGIAYLVMANGETKNFVIAGLSLFVVALLVSCQLRGAFSPSMD